MKSSKSMLCLSLSIIFSFTLINGKPIPSGDGTVDGTGTVTDQNGDPVSDVRVVFYKCISPTKRVFVHDEWSREQPLGYYDWDLPSAYYDIIVKKGTSDEGGYYNTYCEAGTWPNLVRNIQYGVTNGSPSSCPSEEN